MDAAYVHAAERLLADAAVPLLPGAMAALEVRSDAVAADRWRLARAAADAVAEVEARCGLLPAPRPAGYALSHRTARRTGAAPLDLPVERRPRPGDDHGTCDLPCAADELRIGKFLRPEQVRVRAFYRTGSGEELAVKVVSAPVLRARLHHESLARTALSRSLVGVAPPLLQAGESAGLAWLVEGVVRGRHPLDGGSAQRATDLLVPLLVRLHHADRTYEHVASALPSSSVRRLQAWVGVVLEMTAADVWAELAQVAGRVALAAERVVARYGAGLVSRGWAHGDVVPSNVVLHGSGVTLVDWEHVGHRALGYDLVKLLSTRPVRGRGTEGASHGSPGGAVHGSQLVAGAAETVDAFSAAASAAAAAAADTAGTAGSAPASRAAPRPRAPAPADVLPIEVQLAVAGLRATADSATAVDSASVSGRAGYAFTAVARRARVAELLAVRGGLLEP